MRVKAAGLRPACFTFQVPRKKKIAAHRTALRNRRTEAPPTLKKERQGSGVRPSQGSSPGLPDTAPTHPCCGQSLSKRRTARTLQCRKRLWGQGREQHADGLAQAQPHFPYRRCGLHVSGKGPFSIEISPLEWTPSGHARKSWLYPSLEVRRRFRHPRKNRNRPLDTIPPGIPHRLFRGTESNCPAVPVKMNNDGMFTANSFSRHCRVLLAPKPVTRNWQSSSRRSRRAEDSRFKAQAISNSGNLCIIWAKSSTFFNFVLNLIASSTNQMISICHALSFL